MVSDAEKYLYNTYLRISRTQKNKPFTFRKDFSKLDKQTEVCLGRINNLFSKYPHISIEEYFLAPHKVFPNSDHFTLEYYAGMKAVNAYTMYRKQIQELPPDDPDQIQFIQRSLKFIGSYCIKNKIQLSQYATNKTGYTYDWMKHVKSYSVSIYALMEFKEIYGIISSIAEDEKELFLGEIGVYFWNYKTKYLSSKTAKHLVQEGIKRINKVITK